MILTRFPFFQKRFGCNFKGIRPTTTRFIACSCVRRPLLVTSLPQNINACNTSRCVNRSISRVTILLHEAQAIHCNHFKMYSFYSPFHFLLILWLKVWHVHDRTLAEMLSISPNIYTAIAHHVASVDRKTVN